MCRAVKVLCVAGDDSTLAALKRASVGAEWELAPGATGEAAAIEQLASESTHVLVVWGSFPSLPRAARDRFPGIRIIADADAPGVDVVVSTMEEIRTAVTGMSRPGGPVRR